MSKAIKSIRGMHDVLPNEIHKLQTLEKTLAKTATAYGYSEIRTPIIEHVALFTRSAGDSSDIVNKEMYTFNDQNKDILALRPEGTAACVRAGIEHGLLYANKPRLWYIGNMFRRERPQKGRYRQFSQFGLEAYGYAEPHIELEIIMLVNNILSDIKPTLEINHLGSNSSRTHFTKDLVAYLNKFAKELDPDSQRRLTQNPLRIFDSKDPNTQALLTDAPTIINYLSDTERQDLEFVLTNLEKLDINYQLQPKMVRGLDYYTGTVFEWQHSGLTICAGGRYDNLVAELGGKDCPAVGIALGLERMLAASSIKAAKPMTISVLCAEKKAYLHAVNISEELRTAGYNVILEFQHAKLKALLKLANKNNCQYAVILGQQELALNTLVIKNMATATQTEFISVKDFIASLNRSK